MKESSVFSRLPIQNRGTDCDIVGKHGLMHDRSRKRHLIVSATISPVVYFDTSFFLGHNRLLQLRRQCHNLIQKRLALPRRILRDLIPQVVHLRTRRRRWLALRRLNPTNLHLQKELGHLDREITSRAPDSRFGSEIHI
jgi:hypothetical protein